MPDDLYEGLDYEGLLDALAQMGVLPGYQARLGEQMAMAQHLRQSPLPEARQAGRITVAPHPLEHLAAALQRFQGMKELERLQGQAPPWAGSQAGLLGQEYGARRSISPWLGAELRRRIRREPDVPEVSD